jgi:hypothetical protein
MSQWEKKTGVRKKYAFLGMAALLVLFFFNIANSQGNTLSSPKKEAAAVSDGKKDVPARTSSPIKAAIIDSNFSGVNAKNFSGKLETYDVVSDSADGVTENIVTRQGNILAENNDHGTKVLDEFLYEYYLQKGEYDPNVILVKISAGSDADGKVSSERVTEGIIFAVKNGARVVNISLGTLQKTNDVIGAIKYARDHGAVVVAASGNWGDDEGIARKTMSSYAESEGAIAVGAMDDDGQIFTFTSGAGNGKLKFVARTRFGSGTSLAAPVVSADAVSVIEKNIDPQEDLNANGRWDREEIENILAEGAGSRFSSIRKTENSF